MPDDVAAAFRNAPALFLTTRGRRSGAPHRVELWFAYAEGTVYLLAHPGPAGSGPDWYRNLLAAPDCTLEAGGQRAAGRALAAGDQEALERQVRSRFRAKYGAAAYEDWYASTPRLPIAIRIQPLGGDAPSSRVTHE